MDVRVLGSEMRGGVVGRAVVDDHDHQRQRIARAEAVEALHGQPEPAVDRDHDGGRRRLEEPHACEPLTLKRNAAIIAASAVIHP